MRSSKAKGEHKDGILQPKHPEITSMAYRCVVILKHDFWSNQQAFLTGALEICHCLLVVQCPWSGSLLRTVSLIVSDALEPKHNPAWPSESGAQGASPGWDVCICHVQPRFKRESTKVVPQGPARARQRENAKTVAASTSTPAEGPNRILPVQQMFCD